MDSRVLRVAHVYEHDPRTFQNALNELLAQITAGGGMVGDIKYVSDPANSVERRGGFGALVIYETTPGESSESGELGR
jgi:hypothetical protein